MSPESVHLHGGIIIIISMIALSSLLSLLLLGCYIIIKQLEQLESALNLGALPVKIVVAVSELPSKLPPSEKSIKKVTINTTNTIRLLFLILMLISIESRWRDRSVTNNVNS